MPAARLVDPELLGADFTCAPTPRKPIVVARGVREGGALHLRRLQRIDKLAGFDRPFGLPRAFVEAQGLGDTADDVVAELHRRCAGRRMAFRAVVDAWGNGRPAGQRLVHRATDRARVAVEACPGRAAHALIGPRSYQNSDAADRTEARMLVVRALRRGGGGFGLRLALPRALRRAMQQDASAVHGVARSVNYSPATTVRPEQD